MNHIFKLIALKKVLTNSIVKKAAIFEDVQKSLEQKGFKSDTNKPIYSGKINIPGVKPGVSVIVPDNPIINNRYNVFFQIRPGNNFTKSDVNTICVQAEAGGKASAENDAAFGNSDWVKQQLSVIQAELSKRFGKVSLGKLGLGSFSGGYQAVGKIISDPLMKERIDNLVVLDGIHEGKRGQPNPVAMKKWLDFAEMAKKDPSKKFTFVYTAVDPGQYASTSDSAYYLTDNLGIKREKYTGQNTYAGITPATIANQNGFTAIQLFDRKSDKPGYGYTHYDDNRAGSMGNQHVLAAKALPDVMKETMNDWNL